MGMDVYGKDPASETGRYFRNNVWWWRPLANYVQDVAPDLAAKCDHWHSNDGDGLNKADSIRLADKLQLEINTGRCAAYAAAYEAELNAMPQVTCELCEGTGVRKPVPQRGAGDRANGGFECNACQGSGKVDPWAKAYPFSVENVQEFVDFLRESGGFEIC